MVTLILVRHGYSTANKEERFAGHIDIPLDGIGFEQAKRICDYVCKNYKPDAIYSSPLKRCIDTVKDISTTLSIPLIIENDLIEVDGGDWEYVKFVDIYTKDPEHFIKWNNNKGLIPCLNGESMGDAGKRALKAIEKIASENDGKTLVIASHGGVLRAIQCILSGLSLEKFDDIPWAPNACISIVEYDKGVFTPKIFGITEHLEGLETRLPGL